MKSLNHYVFLLICCLTITVLNAQITSVTENDRGDKREINIEDAQIIEINSKLEVGISKTELIKAIKEQYPQLAQQVDLDEKIALFKQALANQSTILNILDKEIPSIADKEQFYDLTISFLEKVIEHPDLEDRYVEINNEFRINNPGIRDTRLRRAYIFSNLDSDLLQYKKDLESIDVLKYSISLLAFKKDKQGGDRVHVQNFDTYTERDYFTLERWVTNLSEEQKKELSELADKAKENNETIQSIFDNLKNLFIANFTEKIACVIEQKNAVTTFLNSPDLTSELTTELVDAIKLKGDELISQITNLISLGNSFDTNLESWDITKPFEIGNKFKVLISSLNEITIDFGSFDEIISGLNTIKDKVDPLKEGLIECFDALKIEFENLQATIPLLLKEQSNFILNKEIGDEVIAFSLDNLPSVGYINLKGTGKRANGDELVLEVVLRLPSSKEGLPEQKILLEQRDFVMQLIGARSETAVGMILANPSKSSLGGDTEREFFFAPSASLLLKFGSKTSYFYNDFLDFGVGLNFAAPDFDTDGTPEFGLGLIATAFKNVISVGYNYNVTLDSTYWFFGVNLPVNLPGLPVNPIKE